MLVRFRRQLDGADLTSVAVLMVGTPQTFNCIAVSTIFLWNDKLVAGTALWSVFPVIVLKAVNFSNFSLGKSLLSNLPLTCCAGKTRKMVRSLECTDYVICDSLPTCPAELQTGLVTVFAERDPGLVVVLFTSQGNVTRSTLEAAIMVSPV